MRFAVQKNTQVPPSCCLLRSRSSRHGLDSAANKYNNHRMADYKGEFMQGEVEADSGVLHLRLNRAPVNAVSGAYFFEIGHFFQLAKGDPNVRAIVLSSTLPKYFTAGLDLKEAAGSLNSHPGDVARKALALKQHILGQSGNPCSRSSSRLMNPPCRLARCYQSDRAMRQACHRRCIRYRLWSGYRHLLCLRHTLCHRRRAV